MKKLLSIILAAGMLVSAIPAAMAQTTQTDSINGWEFEYAYDDNYVKNTDMMTISLSNGETYANGFGAYNTKSSGNHGLKMQYLHPNWTADTWLRAKTTISASKLEPNTKYRVSYWTSSAFCQQYDVNLSGGISKALYSKETSEYWGGHDDNTYTFDVETGSSLDDTSIIFRMIRGWNADGITGTLCFDDVSMYKLDGDNTVGENLVTNGGFEDDAISDFKAEASGKNAVLSWNESGNVSNVHIYQKAGDEYTEIATLAGGVKSYTVENLEDEKAYTFAIKYDNKSQVKQDLTIASSDDYQKATVLINSTVYKEEINGWELRYKDGYSSKSARFVTSGEGNGGDNSDIAMVRSGKKALELKNSYEESYVSAAATVNDVLPNTEYTLTYYRANAGEVSYDAAVSGACSAVFNDTAESDSQYTEVTKTFTTGDDVSLGVTVEFKLYAPEMSMENTLWIDDVTLAAADGENLISNGDFETSAISDLKATPVWQGSVLTWNENSAPTRVYAAKKENGEWTVADTVAGGEKTYKITGLENEKTHTVGIKYETVSKFDEELVIDSCEDYLETTSLFQFPTKKVNGWTSRFYYNRYESLGAKMASGISGKGIFESWNSVPGYNSETGTHGIYMRYDHSDWSDATWNEMSKTIPAANFKPNTTYQLKYWEGNTLAQQYEIEISGAATMKETVTRGWYVNKTTDTFSFTTGDSIPGDLRIEIRLLRGQSEYRGYLFLDDFEIYEMNGEEKVGENLVPNGGFEDSATIQLMKVGEPTSAITNGSYTLATENVYGDSGMTAVIAVFDKTTNKLCKVLTFERPQEYKEDTIVIGGLDDNGSYYAKTMVWDSLTGMKSLAKAYRIG